MEMPVKISNKACAVNYEMWIVSFGLTQHEWASKVHGAGLFTAEAVDYCCQ